MISGGVIGAGAAKRLSAVRWGVAGTIVAAWVITLPIAAVFGAGAYALAAAFGSGALGPLLIVLVGGRTAPLSMSARDPSSSCDGGRERLRARSVSRRWGRRRAGRPA